MYEIVGSRKTKVESRNLFQRNYNVVVRVKYEGEKDVWRIVNSWW